MYLLVLNYKERDCETEIDIIILLTKVGYRYTVLLTQLKQNIILIYNIDILTHTHTYEALDTDKGRKSYAAGFGATGFSAATHRTPCIMVC